MLRVGFRIKEHRRPIDSRADKSLPLGRTQGLGDSFTIRAAGRVVDVEIAHSKDLSKDAWLCALTPQLSCPVFCFEARPRTAFERGGGRGPGGGGDALRRTEGGLPASHPLEVSGQIYFPPPGCPALGRTQFVFARFNPRPAPPAPRPAYYSTPDSRPQTSFLSRYNFNRPLMTQRTAPPHRKRAQPNDPHAHSTTAAMDNRRLRRPCGRVMALESRRNPGVASGRSVLAQLAGACRDRHLLDCSATFARQARA